MMVIFIFVGLGGLEKSTSEESLSEEVVSEVSEDVDADFLGVGTAAGLGAAFSESLSDDEVAEEEEESVFFGAVAFAGGVTNFGVFVVGSLLGVAFEEEDASLGAFDLVFDFNFFAGAGFSSSVLSISESELEVLELALRLRLFVAPSVLVFCEGVGVGNFAPVDSCSSSASLSELELDVDDEDFGRAASECFSLAFFGVDASFIPTSKSLPPFFSSLFTVTFPAPFTSVSDLAPPPFFNFFDSSCTSAMESSSLSLSPLLLLVSSCSPFCLYSLCQSLKILSRLGTPFGSLTPISNFQSSSF